MAKIATQMADDLERAPVPRAPANAVLDALVDHIRAEKLIEVRGSTGSGSASYRYALTDLGRDRARQFLDANSYVGAAPVPLAVYVETMRAVQKARGFITRDRLARGFSHLIIGEDLLDQLGPAVNAGKAVFLYGPPGNGKTVIAEGMGRTLGGDLYVPYALDIDGESMHFEEVRLYGMDEARVHRRCRNDGSDRVRGHQVGCLRRGSQ